MNLLLRKAIPKSRNLLHKQRRVIGSSYGGSLSYLSSIADTDRDRNQELAKPINGHMQNELFLGSTRLVPRQTIINNNSKPVILHHRTFSSTALSTIHCKQDGPLSPISHPQAVFLSKATLASLSAQSDASKKAVQANSQEKRFSASAKIPTPKEPPTPSSKSGLSSSGIDVKKFMANASKVSLSALKAILSFILKTPGTAWYYLTHPTERAKKITEIKEMARKEFDHYWMGSKLLMADVRTARSLLAKTMGGSTLTRRERKQLLRTVSDLFRLVPFSMFVLIPFMEFALPFALRLFPNMLPSTFQDSLKAEETMKRELQSRIAMAQFFQETLEELAKEQKRIAQKRKEKALPDEETEKDDASVEEASFASKQEESAASMLQFLASARSGEALSSDVIIQYAHYFQDDLTLDNMPRMQLINLCKYMSIPPYGSDTFLQFQLRHKIRSLQEDDQRILWEGITSLTKMELREACQERGMRSTGLSKDAYARSLQQWLDLSVNKNVPISLLIMSRIFYLQEEMIISSSDDEGKTVASLADAISGLDKDVLNEVVLEVATSEEKKSDPDVRKIKLEVLTQQNEKIRVEQAEREAAAKKKENAEKTESTETSADAASTDSATESAKAGKRITVEIAVKPIDAEPSNAPTEKKGETAEHDDDRDLSSEEIEAISQLLSPNAVSKEKIDLERIKSAIKHDDREISSAIVDYPSAGSMAAESDSPKEGDATQSPPGVVAENLDDAAVAATINLAEKQASDEADQSTTFSTESQLPEGDGYESSNEEDSGEAEDPVVARLKKRIESMVDKIEVQLSDVQVKIGDKLHFLDKDMDGILSRDEMAQCLQQVLKREITLEEARVIADEMDENDDGLFTVPELVKWIETNKLVQLVKEGRDADMDRIMEKQPAESSSQAPDNQEDPSAHTDTAQSPSSPETTTK